MDSSYYNWLLLFRFCRELSLLQREHREDLLSVISPADAIPLAENSEIREAELQTRLSASIAASRKQILLEAMLEGCLPELLLCGVLDDENARHVFARRQLYANCRELGRIILSSHFLDNSEANNRDLSVLNDEEYRVIRQEAMRVIASFTETLLHSATYNKWAGMRFNILPRLKDHVDHAMIVWVDVRYANLNEEFNQCVRRELEAICCELLEREQDFLDIVAESPKRVLRQIPVLSERVLAVTGMRDALRQLQ